MVRGPFAVWISVILLMGCLAAQLNAQAGAEKEKEKEQGVASQAPAAAEPKASAPSAKTQFPLDAFTEFSALMVGTRVETAAEDSADSHIYRFGKMMRMEGPEHHGYFLTDLSTRETYGVTAASCIHDLHPYIRSSPFAASEPGAKVERVPGAKETLDGHSCQIEDVTIASPKAGAQPIKLRLWEAEDLQGFPIRIDFLTSGGHSTTIRYKNVILGRQDQTLFFQPKACQVIMPPSEALKKKPAAAPAPKKPQ